MYQIIIKNLSASIFQTFYTNNILGDVIDGGSGGIRILQEMMKYPNIIPILGNHEYMAVKSLRLLLTGITEESIETIEDNSLLILTEWMIIV